MQRVYILVITGLFFLSSCVKDQIPGGDKDAIKKQKITELQLGSSSMKMAIYKEYDSLFVGYNPLYFSITDTVLKTQISNAAILISPVMDMIAMKHSCPVDQPIYSASDKFYKGAAVFSMATEGMMGWTMNITANVNGKEYKISMPIVVKATPSGIKLLASAKDQNNVFYYVALVHPQKPQQKIGINDLEVAVYKRNDMMNFPAVSGMALSFNPTMPSMGHGSSNNINPVDVGNGHYKGKVNFSMTGDWRLDFSLSGNGSTFADHFYIDVLF